MKRLLFLVLLLSTACTREVAEQGDCFVGDLAPSLPAEVRELAQRDSSFNGELTLCKVGQYLAIAPVDSEKRSLGITIGPTLVLRIADDTLTVFKNDGKVALQLGDRDDEGHYHSLTYDGQRGSITVAVMDLDLDGQLDYRSFYDVAAHENIGRENFVGGKWRERISRDGVVGYLDDEGSFRTFGEREAEHQ